LLQAIFALIRTGIGYQSTGSSIDNYHAYPLPATTSNPNPPVFTLLMQYSPPII